MALWFPSPRGDKENLTGCTFTTMIKSFRPLAGIKKILVLGFQKPFNFVSVPSRG